MVEQRWKIKTVFPMRRTERNVLRFLTAYTDVAVTRIAFCRLVSLTCFAVTVFASEFGSSVSPPLFYFRNWPGVNAKVKQSFSTQNSTSPTLLLSRIDSRKIWFTTYSHSCCTMAETRNVRASGLTFFTPSCNQVRRIFGRFAGCESSSRANNARDRGIVWFRSSTNTERAREFARLRKPRTLSRLYCESVGEKLSGWCRSIVWLSTTVRLLFRQIVSTRIRVF